MNKKLLAIAVAAFVAAPAIATAQTTLFGQVKYEVGYIDSVVGEGTDAGFVHSSKGTRLGVRGSEDLGGGMSAIYRFQGGMTSVNRPMSGNAFQTNEENWVGLRGGFGTLLLGRSDTAFKKAAVPFRAFTDTLAEPSLNLANFGRDDGIHYSSPSIAGGLNLYLTIAPNGDGTDAYFAVAGVYSAGPFLVSAAYETSPEAGSYSAPIGDDESNYSLGAKWNFGQGDVGLIWQAVGDGDDNVFTLPVNFKVTPNVNLRAAAQYVDLDSGDDWTNFGIGAQYMFSSRTEAFVNIWVDDEVGQTLPQGGTAQVSADSTQFGFGLRHSF